MAVAKMKLVNIVGRLRDFDQVVQHCCLNGNFHAEQASAVLQDYEEFIPIDTQNPYESQLRTVVDLGLHNGISFQYRDFSGITMSDEETGRFIEKNKTVIDHLNEQVRTLTQEAARLEQGITSLEHIKSFTISLDELFSCKFFKVRFGHMPRDSYMKLSTLDEDKPVFFFPLEEDSASYWGFYVALPRDAEKVDEFFNSLYFERVWIIEEAHGTPAEALVGVQKMLDVKNRELTDAKDALEDYWDGSRARFLQIYSRLKFLHDSFDLRRFAAKCGESFYVFGWVPESEIEAFSRNFDDMEFVDCIVEDEKEAGDIQPPTKLVNNKIIKPYESFVEMYGLPNYREIDPTSLLATTYSLFFGIMFGDLGQGLVLFLLSAYVWVKKKVSLAGVLMRCAIFSMIFGTMYNSVFGFEDLLPFTVLPIHKDSSTNYILLVSISIGITLILICMFLNMANGFRQHNPDKILFSNNGVAGLALYITLVTAVVYLMVFSKNILTLPIVLGLIILPLILMFLHQPLANLLQRKKEWMPKDKGEYAIESFFELFEVLLSYLSNTISYVRIGAYVLCHSGMMLAVFTIAQLCGKAPYPIIVVLGNVFVMALEALMVGIQDMRLAFYEMFSRFYQGDGREYQPVRVKYNS